MPSYRPQANIRCSSAARARAVAWVNGAPAGLGTIRWVSGPASASRAWPHGSGRITMPGPPPARAAPTALGTAVRRVVHGAVHVVGPGPQVVHRQPERPVRVRLADQGKVQRREVLRK